MGKHIMSAKAAFFAIGLVGAGCVGPVQTGVPASDVVGANPNVKKLVSANVGFSFKLLRLLTQGEPNSNVFISPLSIGDALCMALNGARGTTRRDIAASLGLGNLSTDDVNSANKMLLGSLQSSDGKTTVSIANSIWFDRSVRVVPRFESVCKSFYNAGATRLDFAGPAAAGTVNEWVSSATQGRIPRIVSPADLRNMAAVLTNAIYFKGEWSDGFRKTATRDADFTLADGHTKTVPLMYLRSNLGYAGRPDFDAVRLPYGNGRISFIVVLPHKSETPMAVLHELDTNSLSKMEADLGSPQDVELYLPRFKAEYKVLLNDALKSAGMASAFGSSADFRDMSPDAAEISKVIHVANLEVDEKGTVAAAATAITITKADVIAPPPGKPIVVRVDHPFLAFVRDELTGAILFAGVIYHPN